MTTFLALIPTILNALIAIRGIGTMVEQACSAVVLWWISRQKTETLIEIADAAALGARAETAEERYQASAKWQKTLQRPRVSV